jgi:hypothetical protein
MTSKSNLPSPHHLPLEVSIMFEPHRLQHELLHAAYASLVPQARRRVASGQESARAPQAQVPDLCRERKAP